MKTGIKTMEDKTMMKKSLFFAAALLTLVACTREIDVNTPTGNITITARTETSADTKTVVEGQTHVYWEPGDEIAVFAAGKSGKFTTDITASAATAEFNGTLGEDAWTEGMDLWAVYPYSKDAIFDGEAITTTLPSEQVARFGSFGKGTNLSVAHSNGDNLQFYNVGGGVRFRLTQEGIKKVTFEGYGGESLSGTVKIGFDENGLPVIREVIDGRQSITLLPPSGNDSFPTNVWFYCVVIPGSLTSGYKLEFYRDTEYSRMASEKAVTIKRSIFGNIDNADEGCVFIPIPTTVSVPDIIDLGLPSGLKWASFNLGATKPEEFGDYYAWGETVTKTDYSWETYKWCNGSEDTLTKYCTDSSYGYDGFIDGKTVLDLEDDAAHVALGGRWRMPTKAEFEELGENCTREWSTEKGVEGYRFTSKKTGNSIFLPAAGVYSGTSYLVSGTAGFYWASSISENSPYNVWGMGFNSSIMNNVIYADYRSYGISIRPVCD